MTEAMENSDNMNVRREALATLLRAVKVRLLDPPEPTDAVRWSRLTKLVREMPSVRAAFDAESQPAEQD